MTGRLFSLVLCLVLQAACHIVVASAIDEPEAVVPTKIRSMESRIVGGVKADKRRHPYFTRLSIVFESFSFAYSRRCGGTLIASDVVLTSAMCLFPTTPGDKLIKIFARVNSSSVYDSPYDYSRETARFLRHPRYNDTVYTNDIALVFLDKRVMGVTLAKINTVAATPALGKALTAIGLGRIKSNPEVEATDLMSVSFNTLSPNACSKYFKFGFKSENQICAGDTKNTCKGDGGGPLLIKGASASKDVQVGIMSYGLGGGCGIYANSFTRVSKYATWITSSICKLSIFKPSTCG